MAVKVVGVQETFRKILEGAKLSKRALTRVGNINKKMIQDFTRRGLSIAQGPRPKRLKKLSPAYIRQRRSFRSRSKFFSVAKSNLTLTGQMLNSLKVRANVQKQTYTVFPSGSRRGRGVQTNAKVAQFVTDQGRAFMGLHEEGKKQIAKVIKDAIVKKTKRLLR